MFKSYLTITFRNLLKHRIFSFINIAGLAIGMACCILIFLYVQDELSFDRFHKNIDRIYRVVGDMNREKTAPESALIGPPIAPAMHENFSAISNAVRISSPWRGLIANGDTRFYEDGVGFADASIFEVFSFPLSQGDPETALVPPQSMVISETMAAKYFGNADPIGNTLVVNNRTEYTITAVMKDMPLNSHFRFEFLASYTGLKGYMYEECWHCTMAYTYILLLDGVSSAEVEAQLPNFLERHIGAQGETGIRLRLQPLREIYLHSDLDSEIQPGGVLAYLYILVTAGCCILLIACINYMNLMTARSARRAKEIGMRKVVGAARRQLIRQFLGESTLLALIALPLALFFVELFMPTFNQLSDKALQLNYLDNAEFLIAIGLGALFTGLLSGSYPAVVISRFHPSAVLKGQINLGLKGRAFRQTLVVLQFAFSILLVIVTAVIFNQLEFIRNKNLGFNKEQVLTIPNRHDYSFKNFSSFKAQLLQHPNIINATLAYAIPPENLVYVRSQDVWPGGKKETGTQKIKVIGVHYAFFETLGIKLVAGRAFSETFSTDRAHGFVLNEAAAKVLGWKSPVGKEIGVTWGRGTKEGSVIGVVEDFHFESLHTKIQPLAFMISSWYHYTVVRVGTADISATIDFLEEQWQSVAPNHPFEYSFLDTKFAQVYKREENLGRLFGYFSAIAIIIACLGLTGLAAFAAEKRTKEIGIRKVLGATVANVVAMISKDFVKLVLLANVIAWPVAWYTMNKWLQDFAYRIDIGWEIFAFAGGLALIIALLTVSTQAVKVALVNPVETLLSE